MIRLKDILEGRFKDRKGQIHLFDTAMFSVFADDTLSKKDLYNLKRGEKRFKSAFEQARQQIHSIGFPSMHSNIVIKDLSKHPNQNTGAAGVGGYANPKGKFMAIDAKQFRSEGEPDLVKIIVHEWAHLWMFNNSKEFKDAVKILYQKLVTSASGKLEPKDVESQVKLTNDEEMALLGYWSEGFENAIHKNPSYFEFINNQISQEAFAQETIKIIMDGFYTFCGFYNIKPDKDTDSAVKEMIKNYVIPKIVELSKDEKTRSELMQSDKAYDLLWVRNDLKPNGTSIVKVFKSLMVPSELEKMKDTMGSGKSFSGKDYEFHRRYLKTLYNWADSYGMSNDEELWATGIEQFFNLPPQHRKAIIKLMMGMK